MTRHNFLAIAAIVILPAMLLAASSAFAADSSMVAPARAAATVRIVVPAHDVARGEVLGESDLTYATIDGGALMSGVPTRINEVLGMQTRRMLAAGQPFRGEDVRRPIVVIKGQTVTMQFAAPGVELTAMGRAMSEGGVGDTVTVQNPASYRMISATVTAPGVVRAAGGPISPPNMLARR